MNILNPNDDMRGNALSLTCGPHCPRKTRPCRQYPGDETYWQRTVPSLWLVYNGGYRSESETSIISFHHQFLFLMIYLHITLSYNVLFSPVCIPLR